MIAPIFDRRAIPPGFTFGEWRAPDGWRHRRFDWPADGAARGSILWCGGRGDFAEKYLEAMAHWHGRGWHVAGFDWRGQGGSGRILPGSGIGHYASFDPLLDDLAAFVAQWRAATPGPHVVIGHSMGGHLVLRALAEARVTADAAVLVAPMIGLRLPRVARVLVFMAGLFGLSMRPVWRDDAPRGKQARLTGSVERFADTDWWRGQDEALSDTIPSWGWLHAAFDSIARLRRAAVERVAIPVLAVATKRDRLVRWTEVRDAVARLPQGRLVTVDAAHEILREEDAARLEAMAAIDSFLESVA
jgi:lysophospholipase